MDRKVKSYENMVKLVAQNKVELMKPWTWFHPEYFCGTDFAIPGSKDISVVIIAKQREDGSLEIKDIIKI